MSNQKRTSRHLSGALVALLVAVGVVALGQGAPRAAAEGVVVASEPRERQELSRAPGAVTLAFADVVDAGVAKLLVLDESGENVTSGELIVEGTNVTSYLRPELARGTYTVQFRVDRADGQPQGGAFQFAYGPGTWTKLEKKTWSGQANQPPIMANPNPNATEPPEPATSTSVPDVEVTSRPTSSAPTTASSAPPNQPNEPNDPSAPSSTSSPSSSSDAATPTPANPTEQNSSPLPWVIGGLLTLVVVAIAAVGFILRGRSRP